jgi:hypothetical protein
MLSKPERRLLYALARDYAEDDAAIVDAGCFLGGSTAALLSGVRDRAQAWAGPPVTSYDLFRVEAYTIPEFFRDDPSVRIGDSFRDRFDANVAGFGVPHIVHEGDIAEIGWSGGPIDVLFLDVIKSWETNDGILRDFFPHLVPGRSVIVHQDYGWGYLPWIPITVELMNDSVRLIDAMENGSHVFLLEEEVPAELMEGDLRWLDQQERLEIIDRAVDRATGWSRGMVEISRAALLADIEGDKAALQDLAAIAERYVEFPFVLSCVASTREGIETNWAAFPADENPSWTARLEQAGRRAARTLLRG